MEFQKVEGKGWNAKPDQKVIYSLNICFDWEVDGYYGEYIRPRWTQSEETWSHDGSWMRSFGIGKGKEEGKKLC